jgi:hypothetical protein
LKWLEDPRIDRLMTQLGKRIDGKYTRRSLAAEKINECLVQVELRRKDLDAANREIASLTAEYERLAKVVKDHERNLAGIRQAAREAIEDLTRQNPVADTSGISRDSEAMLAECQREYKAAQPRMDVIRQSITVKKSTARRHEDRINHYRKQVEQLLGEAEAA